MAAVVATYRGAVLLKEMRGVYSPIDCEDLDAARYPEFADVVRQEVVFSRGEALFIPVSWWHHVPGEEYRRRKADRAGSGAFCGQSDPVEVDRKKFMRSRYT